MNVGSGSRARLILRAVRRQPEFRIARPFGLSRKKGTV